jgi:hypothetical protein
MDKFTILEFVQAIFDDEEVACQAAEIGQAILGARSLRMTDIASHMEGNSDAAYKRIQRFLKRNDPRLVLGRLYQADAEFMIGDPTEIERAQAWKTEYVGTLKDGKTKGFWALVLGTPYRGRAIPCGLVTYSSKTIAKNQDSRNLNHFRAFESVKDLLGDKPLVLDREFSYLELLLNMIEEQLKFVIRLNLGSHPPKFCDQEGQEVALTISPGETVIHPSVWYKAQVRVNRELEKRFLRTFMGHHQFGGERGFTHLLWPDENRAKFQGFERSTGYDQTHEPETGLHGENDRFALAHFPDWFIARRRSTGFPLRRTHPR